MATRILQRGALALACAGMSMLIGCVVAPVGPYGSYGGYASAGDVVGMAPPAPQSEVIGVAPVLGHVWLGGYWRWGGGRHHWVPGQWAAPRAGHAWVPHAWARVGNGWRFNPGHWRRH